MSYLLCIESSTKFVSIALFRDQNFLEEKIFVPDDKTASEKILPAIKELLNKHSIILNKEDMLAVTHGPGAFTSLRVGMATIMGLATGFGCKIVAVSSLRALALQAFSLKQQPEIFVAPLINAGRGRVYAALFVMQAGVMKEIISEGIYEKEIFMVTAQKKTSLVSFVGPGMGDEQIHQLSAKYLGELVFLENPPKLNLNELKLNYLQEPDLGSPAPATPL